MGGREFGEGGPIFGAEGSVGVSLVSVASFGSVASSGAFGGSFCSAGSDISRDSLIRSAVECCSTQSPSQFFRSKSPAHPQSSGAL